MQPVDGTTTVVRSEVMRKLMTMVDRVARQDAAVLIVGETGSGKERIAQAIHQRSPRSGKAFVDVNCAAFPEHLVESELFGYEKGAFSGADATKPGLFEMADQGTLFLDELGELDSKVQAKLLRVLDGAPFYRLGGSRKIALNVRVIAATNRDLEEDVKAGKFRADLYHRVTQFQLQVPPLRERSEDIAALAELFLRQHSAVTKISKGALQILMQYRWPGNVRELKNAVFKATMLVGPGAKEIRVQDLPPAFCGLTDSSFAEPPQGNLQNVEKKMIFQALARSGHNQGKAAQELGISSRTLRRKLAGYRRQHQATGAQNGPGTLSSRQERYFRVNIEVPVFFEVEGQPIEAKSTNISSGGLAVHSPVALIHDAVVEISFALPGNSSTIEAKVKLAWTGLNGLVGLSIVEIHPALERELQQWLRERARMEGWMGSGQRSPDQSEPSNRTEIEENFGEASSDNHGA
jgi:transcriptional regulator with AAA-type ATPase domain